MRMQFSIRTPVGAAAIGAIVLAFAPAGPAAGQATTGRVHGAKLHPEGPSAQPASVEMRPSLGVEARIKNLHDDLRITSAEEANWREFARVMRDNARLMRQTIVLRQQAQNLTAMDDLKSYEAVANARAQALSQLVPVFQTLYDSMSETQKKNADAIIARSRQPP